MSKKEYEFIDHPADLGIRVFGKTREDLFINAVRALFDQLVDLDITGAAAPIHHSLKIEAPGQEELLVCFLSELLHLFTGKNFIPTACRITTMNNQHLEAELEGNTFNPDRWQIKTEIKAVTYHNLKISQDKPGRWVGEVIFDI